MRREWKRGGECWILAARVSGIPLNPRIRQPPNPKGRPQLLQRVILDVKDRVPADEKSRRAALLRAAGDHQNVSILDGNGSMKDIPGSWAMTNEEVQGACKPRK